MAPKEPPTSRLELLQGTLDFIILQALRWGPCHGYGIVQLIRSQSANALQVETGSLYPAPQRLMRKGATARVGGVSSTNGRAGMSGPTAKGKPRLAAERSRGEKLSQAIAGLMPPPA